MKASMPLPWSQEFQRHITKYCFVDEYKVRTENLLQKFRKYE